MLSILFYLYENRAVVAIPSIPIELFNKALAFDASYANEVIIAIVKSHYDRTHSGLLVGLGEFGYCLCLRYYWIYISASSLHYHVCYTGLNESKNHQRV